MGAGQVHLCGCFILSLGGQCYGPNHEQPRGRWGHLVLTALCTEGGRREEGGGPLAVESNIMTPLLPR